jgi:hypothetical protein
MVLAKITVPNDNLQHIIINSHLLGSPFLITDKILEANPRLPIFIRVTPYIDPLNFKLTTKHIFELATLGSFASNFLFTKLTLPYDQFLFHVLNDPKNPGVSVPHIPVLHYNPNEKIETCFACHEPLHSPSHKLQPLTQTNKSFLTHDMNFAKFIAEIKQKQKEIAESKLK